MEKQKMQKERKPIDINPYILIFCVIVICGLLTFLVTPGTLTDGVYKALPRNKFNFNNLFNIFRAIPYGLKDSANIFILILTVGGALEIYKKTGAIDSGISTMVHKFGKTSHTMLLIVLVTVFSAIGGFLGWVEVLIPFVPLVIAVVLALGYDAITAVAVVIVGSMGGFIAGPTNLYTVGVCNGILIKMGLLPGGDLFVGLGFRTIVWAVITAVSVLYIVIYANKTRKNPSNSLVADIDVSDIRLETTNNEPTKITGAQSLVLLSIFGAMVFTVIGMKYGINGVKWAIDDVSAIFILSGIVAGIIGKMKAGTISDAFIAGAKGSISGALIVGVARGVYWVLNAGNINATIIYNATELLKGTSPLIAAISIVIIVSFINGIIPSGSANGTLLSPIMVPIALSLGLTSQTSVLAYQFGDGITNMFWFSYGTLLIFLNYGKVPIQRWYKFIIPYLSILFLIAFIVLFIAIKIGF
ncbi:MAG TPA: AbgT family transporter [Clostridia bacterium]|nr:AbgT family transporter [Clostridia bacterium]